MKTTLEDRIAAVVVPLTFLPLIALLVWPFFSIVFLGDFLGAGLTYGIEEDEPFLDLFFNMHEFLFNR